MTDSIQGQARDQLRTYVERVERLETEKDTIAADIREVYAEARAMGFDAKILRKVVALRRLDPSEREEQDALIVTYMHALGMLPGQEVNHDDA